MELDGVTVSAIGAIVTPFAYALGRAIYSDRKDIVEQLKECTKQHAADQFRLGSFEAAISFLSSTHGPAVQAKVDQMLTDGQVKAEEAKATATVPAKGNR